MESQSTHTQKRCEELAKSVEQIEMNDDQAELADFEVYVRLGTRYPC